jgi:uncharacterized protein YdaU (DUF1376 family)
MKTDTWMPLYIADYLADTLHLTAEQHGMYLLLIMAYWRRGGPLPDDPGGLASVAKVSLEQWQSHAHRMAEFFVVADGKWTHKRIEAELSVAREHKVKRTKAAQSGASARWSANRNANGNANRMPIAMPLAPESQCPEHVPSPSPVPTLSLTPKRDEEPVIPTPEEVETYGDTVGVPANYCAHYHAICCEKHRWIVAGGKLIDWRREIKRWWESDRGKARWAKGKTAPDDPPKVSAAAEVYVLKAQLEAIDAEIAEIRRRGFEDAVGSHIQPEDKPRLRELKARRARVNTQLTEPRT